MILTKYPLIINETVSINETNIASCLCTMCAEPLKSHNLHLIKNVNFTGNCNIFYHKFHKFLRGIASPNGSYVCTRLTLPLLNRPWQPCPHNANLAKAKTLKIFWQIQKLKHNVNGIFCRIECELSFAEFINCHSLEFVDMTKYSQKDWN